MGGTKRGSTNMGGTKRGPANMGGQGRPDSSIKPFDDDFEELSDFEDLDNDDETSNDDLFEDLDEDKGRKVPKSGPQQHGDNKQKGSQPKSLKRDDNGGAFTQITIDGITYAIDKVLSDTTGEAVVYQVSKGSKVYALKLYFSGIAPDAQVMEILKRSGGTGFMVDIISCGYWTSDRTGESRYYELQPYYTGGQLNPGSLAGNAKLLKTTAAAMMMGLKVAHDHNILHKDIKPSNYFYTDPSHSQLVLADFGISAPISRDRNGKMIPIKTKLQWRTKIYAAPEIYTAIDGVIEYSDEKSDYYSLGMSLLTLWMGEKQFEDLDELKLLRMKRGESGTLPYPEDMPDELTHLIKGLTVPNPDKRWGFAEFERWARGENVPVEGQMQRPKAGMLNILYNGRKNQVATTLEELAAYMIDDRRLAEQYLYSGKIAEWLGQAGYPEIKAQMDEISHKLYPNSMDAGVMAACYLLDPDLPFISPKGKKLYNQEEIAIDMADNAPDYIQLLKDPNAPLYVYFRAGGIDLATEYVKLAKKQPVAALWRLIYMLDPAIGFPLYNPDDNTYTLCYTVQELIDNFAKLPDNVYTNRAYDKGANQYPALLYDDAFLMWLAYRDEALAGKIRSKLAQENNTKYQLYYYIFYLLDPERPYELDPNGEFTSYSAEEVAVQMNYNMIMYYVAGREEGYENYESNLAEVRMLEDCIDNRLYYYLKSKELYKDKLDYIHECFDYNSDDNRHKGGPYDVDIATFKAIKALAGDAFYYFDIGEDGESVTNMQELARIPLSEQRKELDHGVLGAWLAVQFQEDPYADFSEDYAYYKLLGQYTEALGAINPSLAAPQRYHNAQNQVADNAENIKKTLKKIKFWRGVFYAIIGLPLLAFALMFLFGGVVDLTPKVGTAIWAFIGWTIVVRVLMSFEWVQENVFFAFNESRFSHFALDNRWIFSGMVGAVLAGGWFMICKYGPDYGRWFLPALCLLLLFYRWWRTVKDYPTYEDRWEDVINPTEEALYVDPAFYAWEKENKPFDSETLDNQKTYKEAINAIRELTMQKTWHSLIFLALVALIWLKASPLAGALLNHDFGSKKEKVETVEPVTTPYEVVNIKSSLTVRSAPTTQAAQLGLLRKGEIIDVIEVKDGWALMQYGNQQGYVNAKYIRQVGQEPDTTPVQPEATQKPAKKDEPTPAPAQEEPALQPEQQDQQEEERMQQQTVKEADEQEGRTITYQYRVYTSKSYVPVLSLPSDIIDDNKEIGRLHNGDYVEVSNFRSQSNPRFARIKYNGRYGYIDNSCLSSQ